MRVAQLSQGHIQTLCPGNLLVVLGLQATLLAAQLGQRRVQLLCPRDLLVVFGLQTTVRFP